MISCDKCGKTFTEGNTNGLPNGISFITRDGRKITLCQACIKKLGTMKQGDKDKFFRELGV